MNTKQDLKSDVLTQIIVRLRICMMKRWKRRGGLSVCFSGRVQECRCCRVGVG